MKDRRNTNVVETENTRLAKIKNKGMNKAEKEEERNV